jgi:hypothetical protein
VFGISAFMIVTIQGGGMVGSIKYIHVAGLDYIYLDVIQYSTYLLDLPAGRWKKPGVKLKSSDRTGTL